MEVKPGYKQTEVGVIPMDWEVRRLKELITIKGGQAFSSAHFSDKGPILLTPGNFKLDGGLYFNEHNTKHYSGPYASTMVFDNGDLLVVMTDLTPDCDLLGKPAFVRLDEVILHNQRIGKIAPTSGRISLPFLYWYFLSDAHAGRMRETATGSTVRHTSNGSIYGSLIALPPSKTEQAAIAEALSDADALIESLEQLLTKKRDLKQGAMQELLTGKKRLPGFSGEWALRPLLELVRPVKFAIVDGPFGTQMKVEEYVSEGVPVIEMEHLKDSVITQRPERCITTEKFEQLKRSAVYPGDIVISKTGSLGHLGVIPDSIGRGMITSRLAKISLNAARANGVFILQYLLKLRSDGYWESVSQGGTMQILGIRMLQHVPIPDISILEQSAIAAILSDMDAEIAASEAKLAKTRQLKLGMMQELLTGRIRLV